MSIKVSDCLFAKDIKTFREIEAKANMTLMSMPVFRLIGSNLKVFIKNYAEKNSIHLKILYLPFNDNQVWGLFYQKKGIYFIVINSQISINKQNVALAHEFYHFISAFEEDKISAMDILKESSLNQQFNDEDRKANAFSSCLLMPLDIISTILPKKPISLEDTIVQVKALMDIFLVPYKTAVIRLLEIDRLTLEQADYYIKSIAAKIRNKLEENNTIYKNIRWEHPISSHIDIDDLGDLIAENEDFEFISSIKATKYKNQVEEILKYLKQESNE